MPNHCTQLPQKLLPVPTNHFIHIIVSIKQLGPQLIFPFRGDQETSHILFILVTVAYLSSLMVPYQQNPPVLF
jgi:hypothetical protein